jgi:hypothetical protein
VPQHSHADSVLRAQVSGADDGDAWTGCAHRHEGPQQIGSTCYGQEMLLRPCALWVDIRGDDGQGQALVLLLGNCGPSVARNVKVVFDPAPPATLDNKPILEILKQGIASVPPSRTMQWALGAAYNTDDWDAHKAYRVRIEAEGPFGAIEPLEYVISVDDLRGLRAAPPGNLDAVAAELREMTKATKELNEIIRSASLEPA